MTRLALAVGGACVVFGVTAAVRPESVGFAFDVLVLFVGAALLISLVQRIHAIAPPAGRSPIETALAAQPPRPRRPEGLERMERRVVLAVANAGDLYGSFAPQFRELAAPLLAVRGVDLDDDPEAARALVGDDAWELLRTDLPWPERPFDRGVPVERLDGGGGRAGEAERVIEVQEVAARCDAVLAELEKAVIGKRDALELVLLGMLCDGHVLIEDYPGLAKTLMARSLASVTSIGFSRVQFTPDLMPSDVTGSSIYNQRESEFQFLPGPVFTNLLLADEINRAPPKTQAALLEAMQERQVTIEGETRLLEPPFVVLATQNPIEYEGTYPLPEAQLDRFLLRVGVGYPDRDDEWRILQLRMERGRDEVELRPVVDRATLLELQRALEGVHVSEAVGRYVVDVVAATRESSRVQVGASPRGTLALLKLARGRAALDGRDYVTPDDVKAVAVPALGHRLMLRPEHWVQRVRGDDVVRDVLDKVPTPRAEDVVPAP